MTAPTSELEYQKRNTLAFIAAHYEDLSLTPRSPQKSGTGTIWVNGETKPVQRVRLVDQSRALIGPQPGTVRGADGKQRRVEYQLVAMPEADLDLWDWWQDSSGIRWEIADILPDNGYERRAQVVRYGET